MDDKCGQDSNSGCTRNYDLVTQILKDNEEEKRLRVQEEKDMIKLCNNNKANQMNITSLYDPVNCTSRVPGNPDPVVSSTDKKRERRILREKQKSGYNIISNIDLSQHNPKPPHMRPPAVPTPALAGSNTIPVSLVNRRRDFDIVSNRYFESNDEKLAFERERSLRLAAARYWQNEKDKERKLLLEHKGKKIFPHSPCGENKEQENRPNKAGISRASFECELKERSLKKEQKDEELAKNRCQKQKNRILSKYDHGYDIIRNE